MGFRFGSGRNSIKNKWVLRLDPGLFRQQCSPYFYEAQNEYQLFFVSSLAPCLVVPTLISVDAGPPNAIPGVGRRVGSHSVPFF